MTPRPLDLYLDRVGHELTKRGLANTRIVEEAREHLFDAIEDGLQCGLSVDVAEREAFARFGTPETIAAQFAAKRYLVLSHLLLVLARLTGFMRGKEPRTVETQPPQLRRASRLHRLDGRRSEPGPRRPWLRPGLVSAVAYSMVGVSFVVISLFTDMTRASWTVANDVTGMLGLACWGLAGFSAARVSRCAWSGAAAGAVAGVIPAIVVPVAMYLMAYGFLDSVRQYPFEYYDFLRSGADTTACRRNSLPGSSWPTWLR